MKQLRIVKEGDSYFIEEKFLWLKETMDHPVYGALDISFPTLEEAVRYLDRYYPEKEPEKEVMYCRTVY